MPVSTPTQENINRGDIFGRSTNGQNLTNVVQDADSAKSRVPERADHSATPAFADAIVRKIPNHHVEYEVAGTAFTITQYEGGILLRRPLWSLRGYGGTLAEAEADLIQRARDQAVVYLNHSPHDMTKQALELRDFIMRVL